MPNLQAIAKKCKNQGLRVLTVCNDAPSDDMRAYIREAGIVLPVAVGSKDVAKRYGVVATPTVYVLDRAGKIVARFADYNDEWIKHALKELGLKP